MRSALSRISLSFALTVAAASGAYAVPGPNMFGSAGGVAATPVAMCGYTCRSGGRYIPGPPSVCYERGLEYCGSSRGPGAGVYGPPPEAREFRRGGYDGGYGGGGCRTVTIERDDGSVRRIRRCE